jgi:TatD DNase family protein
VRGARLRQAARTSPLERLLVETDSPFLAPQKLRGSDNEPANVPITLRAIAAERDETFDEVREATATNAFAIFEGLQ